MNTDQQRAMRSNPRSVARCRESTWLRWIGWLILAVVVVAAAVKLGFILQKQYALHAQAVALRKKAIRAEPRLKTAQSDWRRAVLLRNLVYKKARIGSTSIDPVPLTPAKFAAIISGQTPELCAGMTVTYLGILQAFGIKARLVNLADRAAVEGIRPGDTHVTIEAFLRHQWVLEDPTFNVHWDVDGRPVGIVGLRSAFAQGKHPVPDTDGFATSSAPSRNVETYSPPYRLMTKYVLVRSYHPLKGRGAHTIRMLPGNSRWWQKLKLSSARQ